MQHKYSIYLYIVQIYSIFFYVVQTLFEKLLEIFMTQKNCEIFIIYLLFIEHSSMLILKHCTRSFYSVQRRICINRNFRKIYEHRFVENLTIL